MVKNNTGRVETYLEYMYSIDYRERPVNIRQFISDERFLGKSTGKGNAVYNVWKDSLADIFAEDRFYLIVLTGAIGIGKTYADMIGIAYIMYRVLCLKEPWRYFNLASGSKMSIAFFNLTKTLSSSKGFSLLQSLLMNSSWFTERGILRGTKDAYLEFPLFNYILASPYASGYGTVGEDVIAASMDEVDSALVSDKVKLKILKAYESTVRRFISRFVIDGESLGKFFLVASKQDTMSFIDTFVDEHKNSGRMFVVDIPIWEAKPEANYCGEKFKVSVGNVYNPPQILIEQSEVDLALSNGFEVIEVPVEYREDFNMDIVGALRDIAGKSIAGVSKSKLFPTEDIISNCYDPDRVNPITVSTIKIGLKDDIDLIHYLNLEAISLPLNVPRVIHIDIAYSGDGDALGIAMSGVCGWTDSDVETEEGTLATQKVPVVETDFAMRLKAPPGDQIPLHKARQFIFSLRKLGFNIVKVTSDLRLMSADTTQLLERAGFDTGYFSLDKTIQGYLDFRNLVFEGRWVFFEHGFVHFELKNLIYDRTLQKIDHPDKVKDVVLLKEGGIKEVILLGSKDLSDAVVGSVIGAIKESEMPAAAGAMKHLVKKVMSTTADDIKNKYWWVDGEEPGNKQDDLVTQSGMTKEESKTFLTILKKVK